MTTKKTPQRTTASPSMAEIKRATMTLRGLSSASKPVEPEPTQHTPDVAAAPQGGSYNAGLLLQPVLREVSETLCFVLLDARGEPADNGRLVAMLSRRALQLDFSGTTASVITNPDEIAFPEVHEACTVAFCLVLDGEGRELFRIRTGDHPAPSGTRVKFPAGNLRIVLS